MPPAHTRTPFSGSGFYYGWVIVAVSALVLLVAFGVRLSFTVFFVALTDDFAWSRGSTALIFSVSMLVFAITSTPAGMALDRFGVRRTFGVGALLLALGLFMSSRVVAYWQLVVSYGLVVGLGISILGLGPQAGLISRWFVKRRGVALGIAFAGTGLGTLLLTPGVEGLIRLLDWQRTYMVLAGLALALIPIIVIFLRLNPSSMGLRPDGDLETSDNSDTVQAGSWTLGRAMKTIAFWLLILASLGAIGPLRMLTVHQLAAVVDAGFDSLVAAAVIGLSGAVTAIAFISFGALSDRISRAYAYAIGSACLLGAIVVLSGVREERTVSWLLLYVVLLGLGEGSRSGLVTAVASDLFPGQSLGAINGTVGAAFGLGAAFFPWMAGAIFDRYGAYTYAYAFAGVAILISTAALWLSLSVAKRQSS
jgi:MFS family permease